MYAQRLELKITKALENRIETYRASGQYGMKQRATRWNTAIGHELSTVLETLEQYSQTHRIIGQESVPPLRSDQPVPVRYEQVNVEMKKVQDMHTGMEIFGVPINVPYTDFGDIWQRVVNTGAYAKFHLILIQTFFHFEIYYKLQFSRNIFFLSTFILNRFVQQKPYHR